MNGDIIMAQLVSPGVSVSVIDESAYASAGNGTVPVIVLATRSGKTAPDGSSAQYTTAPFAKKPLIVTSQRELVQLYGEPKFTIVDGTPVHGHELNEYGLLAAYSYLGIANRAILVRADLNMEELEPQAEAPVGPPANNQYWLDTNDSQFGLFEANGSAWVLKTVTVTDGAPSAGLGSNGDYALDASSSTKTYYKKVAGAWLPVTSANLAKTVTLAPHYQIPSPAVAGNVWLKTTSPNGGLNLLVKKFNATTESWTKQAIGPGKADMLVGYEDNATATAAFGSALATNSLYVQFDEPTAARFTVKRFDGASWTTLAPSASDAAPTGPIVDGRLWYDAGTNVDIYVKATVNDTPIWTAVESVHVNTTEPSNPSNGDVWVDTNDMANYPVIKFFNGSNWVQRDNADQTTENGALFVDLTATAGDNSGVEGGATHMDDQVPNPAYYPDGMLLWNSAVSSGNVKRWNATEGFWQSESGNVDSGPKAGAPYMFEKAQRRVVVKRLQAALTDNDDLRAETLDFNLVATPGYVECIDEMITLSYDRKETVFVIGDTPMKLSNRMSAVHTWALGTEAGTNGADGLTTRSGNAAIYYPSGLSTDLEGNDVAVPASHAVLRGYAYNDQVAYPWFAPAGLTRGALSGISNLGVVNAENEFLPVALNQGQRDTLYQDKINPLVNFPGQGLFAWGQKTLYPFDSALDRINVARLLVYLRKQFDIIARPFIFEPNDKFTRDRVIKLFNGFLTDMVSKRAVYDFLVVCDETNNTPARIDRNELYIDIAIEPVKAIEFIYIPVRVVNTGAIANNTK
jgi:hypothetical protein